MIASDEIIVPQAGHAISDSPPEADCAWTATFATGFAICATATGACAAGFATAGAGLDGTGWGRNPVDGTEVVGAGLTETTGPATGVAGIVFIACSCAINCFASSRSRFLFFFQAEDGIRDYKVTGVQTCALPI